MKFTAWKLGYKIVEVPIIFTDRRAGTSKMSGGIFGEAMWGVLRMKIVKYLQETAQDSNLIVPLCIRRQQNMNSYPQCPAHKRREQAGSGRLS
ncbi:MAG: hypothetical protein MZV63_52310 [Marinilabiliales bacterium]|nr:hypothetical protein [Marinilabiliales bacterium]